MLGCRKRWLRQANLNLMCAVLNNSVLLTVKFPHSVKKANDVGHQLWFRPECYCTSKVRWVICHRSLVELRSDSAALKGPHYCVWVSKKRRRTELDRQSSGSVFHNEERSRGRMPTSGLCHDHICQSLHCWNHWLECSKQRARVDSLRLFRYCNTGLQTEHWLINLTIKYHYLYYTIHT